MSPLFWNFNNFNVLVGTWYISREKTGLVPFWPSPGRLHPPWLATLLFERTFSSLKAGWEWKPSSRVKSPGRCQVWIWKQSSEPRFLHSPHKLNPLLSLGLSRAGAHLRKSRCSIAPRTSCTGDSQSCPRRKQTWRRREANPYFTASP